MKTAVVYARFSCSNQTEQSIEGQLRVCKDYAARNHIEIVKEFIDRAKSGTNANRPSFQEMIKYCETEHLDYVLVYKLDRFSRDKYDSAVYKRILRQHGIKVISATETLSDNPESILFESILEGFAQYYSVELAQKVRRGLRECYLKGYCVGGNTPLFGYRIENRKCVIDEDEAKVINEIFHQYALGIKVADIIDDLKRRQVVTKAKASFTDSKIYQMLHDTRYIGKVTHDGIEYNNIFPSIVDENLWNLVQGLLSKNKAHRRLTDDNEYLLVGKIFCGYCNYHMTGINSTSSTGKKYSYYTCRNKKNPNRNCHETIRKDYIEQTVLEQLHKLLNDEGLIEGIASSVVEYAHRRIEQSAVYKNATKRLNEIEKGLRNLILAKEEFTRNNNMPFRQIDKKIEELFAEQDYYARVIQDEKESMDIDLQAIDVINYLSSKEILKAGSYNDINRSLINMFIRAVIVYKDKIIIQFNYSPKLTNKKLTSKDIETLTKQVKIPASFIVYRA